MYRVTSLFARLPPSSFLIDTALAPRPCAGNLVWPRTWRPKNRMGQIFNPYGMTAAHRSLPFGTSLFVSNPKTGKSVRVTVTTRTFTVASA